jgi:hypothetical protein
MARIERKPVAAADVGITPLLKLPLAQFISGLLLLDRHDLVAFEAQRSEVV